MSPTDEIAEVATRERSRLLGFIRRRVPDARDAEDILQDVFSELVEANRLLMPIEHVTAWLFRVARNRITDLFRKKTPEPFGDGDATLGRVTALAGTAAATVIAAAVVTNARPEIRTRRNPRERTATRDTEYPPLLCPQGPEGVYPD